MRPALRSKLGKYLLLAVAVLGVSVWVVSCRNGEPGIPPLTGPSGQRLFLTMEATPEHLLIVNPGQARQVSHISVQLKNQLGNGVPGEHIRLSVLNVNGSSAAIGYLVNTELTTDSGGFVRTDYIAPTKDQEPASVRVYIFALMTNPDYTFEVTDQHALDLELGGVPPPGGNCGAGGLNPLFTFTPTTPAIGGPVCFDASTSTSTSPVIGIKWDFGDGHGDNTGNPNPCHTYTSAGQFFVTLTMTDANSDRCSSTQAVPVTGGLPPVCNSIVINPSTITVGQSITFTSLATDPDGKISHYSWDFGDGSGTVTSRSNVAHHTYKTAGSFTVILTLTDDQGNVVICTQAVTVGTPAPLCSFTANTFSGTGPLLVNFDASSSSGFAPLTFAWDFGDGAVGSGVTPSHTFTVTTPPPPNIFTVTLTVTDGAGTTSTCSNSVTVN